MSRNLVCGECGGNLERGFVAQTLDLTRLHAYDASLWVEGQPEKGFIGWLKTKGRKMYYVTAYRCERCGFMKFYTELDHSSGK